MAFKALTFSKEKKNLIYSKKDFCYMKDLGTKITPSKLDILVLGLRKIKPRNLIMFFKSLETRDLCKKN